MIATIISFCSNDQRFLKAAVTSVKPFSSQILIPVCDHFYDGTEENYALLEQLYRDFPNCTFIEFPLVEEATHIVSPIPARESLDWGHFWHNMARRIAFYFLKNEIEEVLFCDVDEIVETALFCRWLQEFDRTSFKVLRFATYWYFKEASFKAHQWPDGPLMVRKKWLEPEMLHDMDERMGLYLRISGEKKRQVCGLDGLPMIHHFSWVRTKIEMEKKVQCWAHRWERDWQTLVTNEFSRPFTGKDFVRDYTYENTTTLFDPLTQQTYAMKNHLSLDQHLENVKSFPHVKRVEHREIFRKDATFFASRRDGCRKE